VILRHDKDHLCQSSARHVFTGLLVAYTPGCKCAVTITCLLQSVLSRKTRRYNLPHLTKRYNLPHLTASVKSTELNKRQHLDIFQNMKLISGTDHTIWEPVAGIWSTLIHQWLHSLPFLTWSSLRECNHTGEMAVGLECSRCFFILQYFYPSAKGKPCWRNVRFNIAPAMYLRWPEILAQDNVITVGPYNYNRTSLLSTHKGPWRYIIEKYLHEGTEKCPE
jgi:hypothetical protein